MPESFEEIIGDLEAIAERIGDLGMQALREAIGRGEKSRPDAERRATRARSGILRAASILRGADIQADEAD